MAILVFLIFFTKISDENQLNKLTHNWL